MIFDNHQLAYKNVASKLYNFAPEEIGLAISDFDQMLEQHGYEVDGPLFFSIISDPTAELMTAEIFRPLRESWFSVPASEDIVFRSYFLVKKMIMTRVLDNFNEISQVKFWELLEYAQKHQHSVRTPIFVEYKQSHAGKTYIEMSVGV